MGDIFRKIFRYTYRYDSHPEILDTDDWNTQPSPTREGLIDQESDDLLQHFDQHFRNVFESIGSLIFNTPTITFDMPQGDVDNSNKPLRDNMLKSPKDSREYADVIRTPLPWFRQPFEQPSDAYGMQENKPFQDQDLDSAVSSGGLDSILKNPQRIVEPPSRTKVFSSSSSITFRGSGGKFEEKVTKRDSLGNEYTTVRRRLGDQEHSVTTKRDEYGIEEKNETFVNIDEEKLKDFENSWSSNGASTYQKPTPAIGDSFRDMSMFERLFKGFTHPPK